ncbi:Bkd operon transcriptional regulator [uncultured Paludibacter sp.]|nr:Bkd operon transcriptional regulator [uncultured Paludibacter sp.]
MYQLDKTDLQILRFLQEDGRLTTKDLAMKVNLSSTPVYDRVKRLEKEGFIKKYMAILDYEKLNRGFAVYCNVKLKQLNAVIANEFAEEIQKLPEVTECYNISGDFDYLLKIQAPDMKYYQHFLLNKLGKLSSISGIQSVFVMGDVKQPYEISIETRVNSSIEYYI